MEAVISQMLVPGKILKKMKAAGNNRSATLPRIPKLSQIEANKLKISSLLKITSGSVPVTRSVNRTLIEYFKRSH